MPESESTVTVEDLMGVRGPRILETSLSHRIECINEATKWLAGDPNAVGMPQRDYASIRAMMQCQAKWISLVTTPSLVAEPDWVECYLDAIKIHHDLDLVEVQTRLHAVAFTKEDPMTAFLEGYARYLVKLGEGFDEFGTGLGAHAAQTAEEVRASIGD